ncbi:MAG: phosphoadenylyl-sulfate reductase [Chloroflexota bacterium]
MDLSTVTFHWNEEEIHRLNDTFIDKSPEHILDWATKQFEQDVVLTCSFGGPSGMVLLDMLSQLGRGTPVVFLDTDLLFPETYTLAEAAAQRYGITIECRRPALSLDEQSDQFGPQLYEHDPDRCCGIRKVQPLADALRPYHAWISGIRRDQSSSRSQVSLIEWNRRHQVLKLNPLAFWTEREVWSYIHKHDVPYNPLLDQGYSSLGCTPCTRRPQSLDDPRSGRWVGSGKTECGIHI